MISIGVDLAKSDADETVVTLCRAEDDGACTIIKILRGEVAEYFAQLKAENDKNKGLREALNWLFEKGDDGVLKYVKVEGEGDTWHIPETIGLAILTALRGD